MSEGPQKKECPLTAPRWNRSVFKKCAPACDNCFASKYGCDRRRPCCSNCARRRITCTYSVRPCGRPSKNPAQNAARVVEALSMIPFTAKRAAVNRPLTLKQRAKLRERRSAAKKFSNIIARRGDAGPLRIRVRKNAAATNTLLAGSCMAKKRAKRARRAEREFIAQYGGMAGALTWPEIEVAFMSNRSIDFPDVIIDNRRELLVAIVQMVRDNYFVQFTQNRGTILNDLMRIALREQAAASPTDMEFLADYLSYKNLSGYDALTQFRNMIL